MTGASRPHFNAIARREHERSPLPRTRLFCGIDGTTMLLDAGAGLDKHVRQIAEPVGKHRFSR
ncbi:hypothetical protein BN2476_110120 [Paraburkholderia piptadeniae]|uniref:Uncharacterized protein n=1 Tax=Paraburkholderia piptadeniae TaxID=1701573 RepID=A0A1N7RPT6_9BURK|nr:hypothetical protein BN2476_110120 [Paraburkholderia piptadeniae]